MHVSMPGTPCRVHFPRLECRTDATHVLRCALGTGVRVLNWGLAATAGVSALCLAAGISRSALICRMIEVLAHPEHSHHLLSSASHVLCVYCLLLTADPSVSHAAGGFLCITPL